MIMNWNNNDTKYIIKRLIIGFGMLILFTILTTYKAKALTDTSSMSGTTGTVTESNTGYREWVSVNQNIFGGYSDGRVMFTFTTSKGIELQEIYLENNNRKMACTFGDNSGYSNNTEQFNSYSVECYADFLDDQLRRIHILYYNHTNPSYLYIPKYISYYSYDTPKSVISAINNSSSTSAIQALQQAQQQNTNAIINSINSQASQAHADAQQAHQDSQDIKNTLTNDNVDGANADLDNFKNSSTFSDSTGLQAVLELPLNLVNSFTNTCQPISITIPWFDYTGTIPCMSTIYRQHFNGLYSVVALIVNAFFIYRILLKIYELVHNAKQPDEDKLEVIDL